jgi:uroporphyrinogen-III synthase
MEAEHLSPPIPDNDFSAVIFTSETGVAAAVAAFGGSARLPVDAWCVGDHTAKVARDAGFRAVSAGGDADALFAAIIARQPKGMLLHLHGQEVRGDLAQRLKNAGIETISSVVYRQTVRPLTPVAEAVLKDKRRVIVPLFSPRTAVLLCAEYRRIGGTAPMLPIALSPAVAAAFDIEAFPCRIAARPDAGAMIDEIALLIAADAKA